MTCLRYGLLPLLLMLTTCNRAPSSHGALCGHIETYLSEISDAQYRKDGTRLSSDLDMLSLARMCVISKWPDAVTSCLLKVKTKSDLDACVRQLSPADASLADMETKNTNVYARKHHLGVLIDCLEQHPATPAECAAKLPTQARQALAALLPALSKALSNPALTITSTAPNEFLLVRRELVAALADPAFARQTRVVPKMQAGAIVGFKLYGMRPDSLANALQLENGDTVIAFNDTPLTSGEVALKALESLKRPDLTQFQLRIERHDEPLLLTYRIQ